MSTSDVRILLAVLIAGFYGKVTLMSIRCASLLLVAGTLDFSAASCLR